jgi:hypothetical protein
VGPDRIRTRLVRMARAVIEQHAERPAGGAASRTHRPVASSSPPALA